jgi:hypothetical protein
LSGRETETPGAATSRTAASARLAFEASLHPRTTSKPPREARVLAATRPMPVLAPVMRTVLLFWFVDSALTMTEEVRLRKRETTKKIFCC